LDRQEAEKKAQKELERIVRELTIEEEDIWEGVEEEVIKEAIMAMYA
jgi:hypothetical protein